MNNISNKQQTWGQILETEKTTLSFLDKRVKEITEQLKSQTVTYEKTNALQRIKWVAQIIFHSLRLIGFFLLEKSVCLFRLEKLQRRFSIKVSDALMRIGALAFRFKCHKELLIASHNSHNLKASKLYLERNIKMDGVPFDTLQQIGKCWGSISLFTALFLKAREMYPATPMNELIIKIGSLFKHGAPPEASILQNMQGSRGRTTSKLFSRLFNDFKEYCNGDKKYESLTISKKEITQDPLSSIEKFNQLEIGKPYHILNRVLGLHSSLIIRTDSKEFFFFDPNVGLSIFNGDNRIRRLPKMPGYEMVTKKTAMQQGMPSNTIKIQHFFKTIA